MHKIKLVFLLLPIYLLSCISPANTETSGGWKKYEGNPVLGGSFGTIFDISVLNDTVNRFEMYSSWRPKRSIALSESTDGLKWSDPVICLSYNDSSGWERDVNRPVVIKKEGKYHMWYTGETDSLSQIGYAISDDGKHFTKVVPQPVVTFSTPWEKKAVQCPHVMWDEKENIFKMWYSGGEQYEPDAIGYATSTDGIQWKKYEGNPVLKVMQPMNGSKQKLRLARLLKERMIT